MPGDVPLQGTQGMQADTSPEELPIESALPAKPVPELRSILKASRPDGHTQRDSNSGKAITWMDLHGRDLTMVYEFEASESDYSEDGDNAEVDSKACCCIS